MGAADVIPGVSGGTMALITGIYEPLLKAIRSVDAHVVGQLLRFRFRKAFDRVDVAFLAWLGAGIAGAILFFTKVVPLPRYMMSHPELVYGLFFGLILGSIVILLLETRRSERSWSHLLWILAGAAIGFRIVTLVPTDTPETWWFVFLSGALAICAMILPGISGSFILLILRKYDYILARIGELGGFYTLEALMVLVPFALGALAGLALFSRFLGWLLDRFHTVTLMVLVGFLIGSLWVIWPWQHREYVESVRSVRELAMTDPIVKELQATPPDPYALRFRRIGRVVNPEAAFAEFRRVEVEEVSRKLISSTPLWPGGGTPELEGQASQDAGSVQGRGDSRHLTEGLGGMAAGLLLTALVHLLGRRRRRS